MAKQMIESVLIQNALVVFPGGAPFDGWVSVCDSYIDGVGPGASPVE
jgi:hypothetical protein